MERPAGPLERPSDPSARPPGSSASGGAEQEEKELTRKIELSEKSPPRPFVPPAPEPAVDPRAETPYHNDDTLTPEVEKGSFKTERPVDMDNLSPEEVMPAEIQQADVSAEG